MFLEQEDYDTLNEYIQKLKDKIGLRDWVIYLSKEPTSEGQHATFQAFYGQKRGIIEVNEDFRKYPAGYIRMTIVHELVHCHLAGSLDVMIHDLPDLLTADQYDSFFANYKRHLEFGVDGIATNWAKKFPLIKWTTETTEESFPAPEGPVELESVE